MVLQAGNFASGVVSDVLLTDLKRAKPLLNVLLNSPTSRSVEAMARKLGAAGGFAQSLTIPLLKQTRLSPTDGYQTVSSFPSSVEDPDLSSAYASLADYPVAFNVNRVAVGTNYVPTMHAWTHASGDLLMDQAIINNREEIGDVIEAGLVADMISSTVYETVSSGAGVKFALDTTAQANLLADLAQLAGEFNRQNIPVDDRWLVLNSTVAPALPVKYDGLSSRDFDVPGSRREGQISRVAGFNLLFSNNITAANGIAFSTSRYALVLPNGIVLEELKDKDRIGDFMRMYAMFGMGSVSEIINAADGNSPTFNAQRVGLVALSVS